MINWSQSNLLKSTLVDPGLNVGCLLQTELSTTLGCFYCIFFISFLAWLGGISPYFPSTVKKRRSFPLLIFRRWTPFWMSYLKVMTERNELGKSLWNIYLIEFSHGDGYKSVGMLSVFCIMPWGVESEKKILSNKLGFVRIWRYKYIQEW